MRKVILTVGVVSLMAGAAMAAEPLTNQQMDKVTAGLPAPPFTPQPVEFQLPSVFNAPITVQNNFQFPYPADIPRPQLNVFSISVQP